MENLTTEPKVEHPNIKQIKEALDVLWEDPILTRRYLIPAPQVFCTPPPCAAGPFPPVCTNAISGGMPVPAGVLQCLLSRSGALWPSPALRRF